MFKNVEELTLHAWPSLQTMTLDGWLLRFANGCTKRANSISPLYEGKENVKEKIEECEALYKENGLATIFKITPFTHPSNLDALLEERHYVIHERSSVKIRGLNHVEKPSNDSISIDAELTNRWLELFSRFSSLDDQQSRDQERIIRNILSRKAFFILYQHEIPVACGFGVVTRGYFGLHHIVTEEKYRNQGYGKQLILNMLSWARDQGIATCYLQVVKHNFPAVKLYQRLGFQEIYEYWYRIKKND